MNAGTSRNPLLIRGLNRFPRSVAYHKKGKWVKKSSEWKKQPKKEVAPIVKPFNKVKKPNETRTVHKSSPKYYPVDAVPKKLHTSHRPKPAHLRHTITPGTVLILLGGKFRGRRVVFLKQLVSGLLLVTGPYAINKVPLIRVQQGFVIATSTKVDISSAKFADLDDKHFAKPKEKKPKSEAEYFQQPKETEKKVDEAKVKTQKNVDDPLVDAIKKVADLEHYLKSKFSLRNGQYPHELKF